MPSIRPAVRIAPAVLLLVLAACRGEDDGQASPVRVSAGAQPASEPRPAVDPLPPSLVGRWQGADDQVEFFAGGRMLLRRGEIRGTGRYEFVEPRRVLLAWEGLFAGALPGDYAVRVAGDSLSLCETDRPGRCIRYARMTGSAPPPPVRPLDPAVPRLAESPRGPTAPPEARTKEAEVVLKQAFTLQHTYKAERGTYAATMDSLRVVGWEPPPALRYYHPPRVTQWRDRLCVVMEPRDADLWPVHVDDEGDLGRGRACR